MIIKAIVDIIIANNFMILNAAIISEKGYIIKHSIAINHENIYNNIVKHINENRDALIPLIKACKAKIL